jgi:hypothetical protein
MAMRLYQSDLKNLESLRIGRFYVVPCYEDKTIEVFFLERNSCGEDIASRTQVLSTKAEFDKAMSQFCEGTLEDFDPDGTIAWAMKDFGWV